MSDNRTAIFDALVACGATTATVFYDGSGDSGQMYRAECDAEGFNNVRLPFEKTETSYVPTGTGNYNELTKSEAVDMTLPEAIHKFCWDILEEKHGGWENDAGGSGKFEFNVAERTVSFEHNEYYTESNTSYYEV